MIYLYLTVMGFNCRANINAQNVGTCWTPLHCAAFQGHGPVILKLMNFHPDLNIKDSRNR